MADEEKTVIEDSEEQPKESEKEQEEKLFDQNQVNELVGKARTKERKKYSDYNELKSIAENAKGLQENYDKLEKELSELKHEKQVREWKESAGKEFGISYGILRGDTEEEIREHAEQIKGAISYPKLNLDGVPKEGHERALTDQEKTEKSLQGLVCLD